MSLRRTRFHRRLDAPALAVVALAGLGGSAYALSALVGASHDATARAFSSTIGGSVARRQAPVLSIRAQTSRLTVVAGATVTDRLRIVRARQLISTRRQSQIPFGALVRPTVGNGLPAGVSASFKPRATRSWWATLTVRARRTARPGTYRVRLMARGRLPRQGAHYVAGSASTVLTLTVLLPSQSTFKVRGTAAGLLTPGGAASIDLRLTNPNGVPLKIERLVASILRVRAPEASLSHPCTVGDFAVVRFSGAYGFKLPASRTSSLSQLGFPPGQWPAVLMLNRPVNQDGCKRASLTLSYSGVATRWPR
jgi:hypothetical protein